MKHLLWIAGFTVAIVIMETCAMSCLKKSEDGWHWFFAGVLFYVGVATILTYSLKLGDLAVVNALWSAVSIMATTTVGALVFKERLHMHDYIAIAMIGGGVLILKSTR